MAKRQLYFAALVISIIFFTTLLTFITFLPSYFHTSITSTIKPKQFEEKLNHIENIATHSNNSSLEKKRSNQNTKKTKNTKKIKYDQLRLNGLEIDEFIINNANHCNINTSAYNKNVLLFDAMSLHSPAELHIIAIRVFELCEYVDLFIIVEIMYFPDGTRRQSSVWKEKEKYLNFTKILGAKQCSLSQIVHHAIYRNIFAEGDNLGKSGENLQRIYWDEIRRNLVQEMVYQDCFEYFGDSLCIPQNMHNIFVITGDTDEIPRNSAVKLLKLCDVDFIPKPITMTSKWHAYDFGCHLNKFDHRLVKIVSIKDISPDIRQYKDVRKSPRDYQRLYNFTYITYITHGGWHLTYFGDAKGIVIKNKHKAHLFFHHGKYVNEKFQQCKYEICSYYVHGPKSYRVKYVNKSDKYYPLLVNAQLSDEVLSPFLKRTIDVDPSLYANWSRYANITKQQNKTNNPDQQTDYCTNHLKQLI